MTGSYRTYYVNQKTGRDSNDGLTMDSPFASLFQVNRLKLYPGDKVLLARDSIFTDQFLQMKDSGTREHPIEIGSYSPEEEGEGKNPLIAAGGQGIWYQDYGTTLDSPAHVYQGYVSSAVLLYDVEHVVIHDIEISNQAVEILGEDYSAPHKMNRTGVAVVAKDADEKATGVARFKDITVEGCFVYKTSRWGIAVGYTYAHDKFQGAELPEDTFLKYGHENMVIRDNYVKAAGGDGITAMYALRPLVEHNTADSVACEINDRIYCRPENRAGKVAAGIWPWKCKDALFRCNEVADTRLNQDGMAYDADSGDGTIYEYNYSRQNEGGCIMFCQSEAIHNSFCHNVSYDDLGGTVSPSENPDALLAHNTFYVREGVPFVRNKMGGGTYTEEDNTIIPL